MNTETRDVRDAILEAAERCFYSHGITATGVNTLAEEANVSKRTLYNHFANKEEVVAAYIQRRVELWRQRLASRLERFEDPMERLLAYVEEYCYFSAEQGHRGCAYVNAAAELEDDHPALSIIRESLADIQRDLAAMLEEIGLADPRELTAELLVVLEGALSVSGMQRSGDAWDTGRQLVAHLVASRLATNDSG